MLIGFTQLLLTKRFEFYLCTSSLILENQEKTKFFSKA